MMGGLIAVLVLAIWSMRPSSPAPAAAVPVAVAPAAQQARNAGGPVPVKLDKLTEERQPPGNTPRNPFRYEPKPVPPPVRPVMPPPSNVSSEPLKPLPPVGPPPAPPISLKFIGFVTRANGVQWAALTDGKNLMYGRDGDIVDGRYRIVEIGTESIVLTHVDGRGRQVIRLTGQ